jgi:hypothetical protein
VHPIQSTHSDSPLTRHRLEARASLRTLAAITGLSYIRHFRLEHGASIRPEEIAKIADALRIKREDLAAELIGQVQQ